MARPDPIQYAERLYGAIRAANFSPISFLSFGNAIKDGVSMRNMPRIAAEPFMRVVGEMLDLEEAVVTEDDDLTEAEVVLPSASAALVTPASAARDKAQTFAPDVHNAAGRPAHAGPPFAASEAIAPVAEIPAPPRGGDKPIGT